MVRSSLDFHHELDYSHRSSAYSTCFDLYHRLYNLEITLGLPTEQLIANDYH